MKLLAYWLMHVVMRGCLRVRHVWLLRKATRLNRASGNAASLHRTSVLLGPPKFHKSTGYVYAVGGVLVGGTAGLWMSGFAFGGLASQVGFAFLALLCFGWEVVSWPSDTRSKVI